MIEPSLPEVECEQQHASVAVSDVLAAVEFYTKKLGFRPGFTWGDPPTIAGVNLGNVQMFLEQGHPESRRLARCTSSSATPTSSTSSSARNGVEIVEEPGDRPYGLRDYRVRDLHGYRLGFGHHLLNAGPPIEIERVDVPVRLEKRLAALLHDLAALQAHEPDQLSGGDPAAHLEPLATASPARIPRATCATSRS